MDVRALTGVRPDGGPAVSADAPAEKPEKSPDASAGVSLKIPFENRDDLLDLATTLALANDRPERTVDATKRAGAAHRTSIWLHGEGQRERDRALRTFHATELHERRTVELVLAADEAQKRALDKEIVDLDSRLEQQRLRLRAAREKTQAEQLQSELTRAESDQERALYHGRTEAEALKDAETAWTNGTDAREKQLERLETDLTDARGAATNARKRLDDTGSPSMTRNVAGFLVWVGYGSVVATGAMLSMLFGNHEINWTKIIGAMRSYGAPSNPWLTLIGLTILLLVWLALIVGVAWVCDWLMTKLFPDEWNDDKPEPSRINLTPSPVTRRAYRHLLASIPILFAVGVLLAFLASGPTDIRVEFVAKFIPSLTRTFIGTAIALLATAVFVLYVVKVIERRRPQTDESRKSWEVVVIVSVLIVAVIVSVAVLPSATPPSTGAQIVQRASVGAWTLFMLLSSLAFAYGLVYNGLFKDISKADSRVTRLERDIERKSTPPTIRSIREEATRVWPPILRKYVITRFELEQLARQHRLATLFGVPFKYSVRVARQGRFTRLFAWFHPRDAETTTAASEFTTLDLAIKDNETAIQSIEQLLADRSAKAEERRGLERRIEEERQFAGRPQILQTLREIANLTGRIDGSVQDDLADCATTLISEEELILRLEAAIAAANRVRPPFDAVAGDAARRAASKTLRTTPPRPQADQ